MLIRFEATASHRYLSPHVDEAVQQYVEIAKAAGVSPMQLAYLFCKSKWFIPTVLVGASSIDQLKENIEGFSIDLSEDILEQIDAVHAQCRNPVLQD